MPEETPRSSNMAAVRPLPPRPTPVGPMVQDVYDPYSDPYAPTPPVSEPQILDVPEQSYDWKEVSKVLRKNALDELNRVRIAQGEPPLTEAHAPVGFGEPGDDQDFLNWIDEMRPGKTTGQSLKKAAGNVAVGLANIPAFLPRAFAAAGGNQGPDSPYGRTIEPVVKGLQSIGEAPEGVADKRTWLGAGLETAGGIAPFIGPQGMFAVATGTGMAGMDVAEASGAGANAQLLAGLGAAGLGGGGGLLLGHAAGAGLNKVLPKVTVPVLGKVAVGAEGDAIVYGAKSVAKEAARQTAIEAGAGATMMGGTVLGQGIAEATVGGLSGNAELGRAGLNEMAQTPVAMEEGALFGPVGAVRGAMGARAANRQQIRENLTPLTEGVGAKVRDITAPVEPAMAEARAAADVRLAQEAQAQQAMQAEGQRIEMDRAAREQAALEQIRDAELLDVQEQRAQQLEAFQKQEQARLDAEAETRATREVVQQPVAEAKAAEVAAQERAAEVQAKADAESVALAKELKALDLNTFEGQKKAIDILNRKPAEAPVREPVVERPTETKPVVEPKDEIRAPQRDEDIPEAEPEEVISGFTKGQRVVFRDDRLGMGDKDSVGIFEGVKEKIREPELDEDGIPIPTESGTPEKYKVALVTVNNHPREVPLESLRDPATDRRIVSAITPRGELTPGRRVSPQGRTDKAGTVTRTSPTDPNKVLVRWDGSKAEVPVDISKITDASSHARYEPGTVVSPVKRPDMQVQVVKQEGRKVTVVDSKNKHSVVDVDALQPAPKADITEADVNAQFTRDGADFEMKDGVIRKKGDTSGGVDAQLLRNIFAPKTEATVSSLHESLRQDPAGRAQWEREHRQAMPRDAKEFGRINTWNPAEKAGGAYSDGRIQLAEASKATHEVAHHYLTKKATAQEATTVEAAYKKATGQDGKISDRPVQEWAVKTILEGAGKVPKTPVLRKMADWLTNLWRRVRGKEPLPKTVAEFNDALTPLRNVFKEGGWMRRTDRTAEPAEQMFGVRKTKGPGEVYDPSVFDEGVKTPGKDRYATREARTQAIEDLVRQGNYASGLQRKWTADEIIEEAQTRGLDKLSSAEIADKLRESPADYVLMMEAMLRAEDLAMRGTKAADKELVDVMQAQSSNASDVGRTLAVISLMSNSRVARTNKFCESLMQFTPSEQRSWNRAIKEKNGPKKEWAEKELDRLREVSADRKSKYSEILRQTFDIDIRDSASMRKLEDPETFFAVSQHVNALKYADRSFWQEFKDNPVGQSHDMMHEFWMNAIMSGPASIFGRNPGTNLIRSVQHLIQKPIEAVISGDARHLGSFYAGFATSLKQAARNFGASFKSGEEVLENKMYGSGESAYEFNKKPIPGMVGSAVRSVRSTIVATDSFFRTMSAHAEVAYQANKLAKKRGYTGEDAAAFVSDQVNNIQSESWAGAFKRAKEQYGGELAGGTPGKLGYEHLEDTDFLRPAIDYSNKIVAEHPNTWGVALKWGLPFRASPLAWFRTGLAMTPLKVVSTLAKYAAHKKNPEKFKYSEEARVRDVAECITALGTSAFMTYLAFEDAPDGQPRVTGIVPGNKKQAGKTEQDARIGTGDYTVWVPGYGRVSVRGWGPISEMAAFSGAVRKIYDTKGEGENVAIASSDFLTASLDRLSAINDAVRVKDDPSGRAFVGYFSRIAGGFMPRMAKEIIDASRPGIPDTRVKPDLEDGIGSAFLDMTAAEMRLVNKAAKVSYFGDTMEKQEPAPNIFFGVMKTVGVGPLAQNSSGDIRTVERWMQRDGFVPAPPNYKSDKGIEPGDPKYFKMTDQQYEEMLRLSGQAHRAALEKVTDKFKFDPVSDPKKADELKKKISALRTEINTAARWAVLEDDPAIAAKYRAVVDQLSRSGHTVFNKYPAGLYNMAKMKLDILEQKRKREVAKAASDASEEE